MDRTEALIMEERRQAQLFLNAIQDATRTLTATLPAPMISALAIAVATFEGAMLTAVPEGTYREQIAEQMRRVSAQSTQQNEGKARQVTVVNLGKLQ